MRFLSYQARENSLLQYLLYIHRSLFFSCLKMSTYDENDTMIYHPKFLSLILRGGSCFFTFPFKLLRGKSARGRPELIPSCMPYV